MLQASAPAEDTLIGNALDAVRAAQVSASLLNRAAFANDRDYNYYKANAQHVLLHGAHNPHFPGRHGAAAAGGAAARGVRRRRLR